MRYTLLFILLIRYSCSAQEQAAGIPPAVLSSTQWKQDIEELIRLLEQHHPDPYRHIGKADFERRRDSLMESLGALRPAEIVTRMMKLVSSVRDGHTVLLPSDPNGFNHWFPLSFYQFSDGLYIVSAHRDYAHLVGKKVVAFGLSTAERAREQTADLLSSDNAFGRDWNTFYLSSGDALKACGVIDERDALPLTVEGRGGERIAARVKALTLPFSLENRFWGEMYANGDRQHAGEYVMAGGLDLQTYTQRSRTNPQANVSLPLHLKSRRAYWHAYLAEQKTMYVHITHVTDEGRGEFTSFQQFYDRVFEEVEKNDVEKFVLDIRYNSGGDGSVLIPFVHKFIRCDKINQEGKLFTITGRKTFSAGVMLYDLMLKHTKTLLVGEPAGAPRSSYGDAGTYFLRNSKLQFDVSSTYWQLTHSRDTSWFQPVDIPAVFTGEDYFSGRDPAMDYILGLKGPFRSMPSVLKEQGGVVARGEYAARKRAWGGYPWWKAFEENQMRFVSRDFFKASRNEDAVAGFEILLDQYPDSWRAWRDLGDGYVGMGDTRKALACYERGLALHGGNTYFRDQIDKLSKR